jgi:hypothetical protein
LELLQEEIFAPPQTLPDHLFASRSAALQQQTVLHENSQDWECGQVVGPVSALGMQ